MKVSHIIEAKYRSSSQYLVVVNNTKVVHAEPFTGTVRDAIQQSYQLVGGEPDWHDPSIEKIDNDTFITWEEGLTYSVITNMHNIKKFWPKALKQITEAKYYRRHSVKDVHIQYRRIVARREIGTKTNVGLTGTRRTENMVFGSVYAYGIKDEDQFRNTIEQFMRKNEAPYDRVIDIEELSYDGLFQGVVIYKRRSLNEAKYAGGLDLHTANQMYQDSYEASDVSDSKIKMSRPSIAFILTRDQHVDATVMIPIVKTEKHAIKAAISFAKRFNIPYTDIKASEYNQFFWKGTIGYYPYGKKGKQ